jgi:hypothetical protein
MVPDQTDDFGGGSDHGESPFAMLTMMPGPG